jgi:hypothetical protein
MNGTGPPPEKVSPRLDPEATHKVGDDDSEYIVRPRVAGKADIH